MSSFDILIHIKEPHALRWLFYSVFIVDKTKRELLTGSSKRFLDQQSSKINNAHVNSTDKLTFLCDFK